MSFKQALSNTVERSECYQDIASLISILPFKQLKSALSEYIDELNDDNILRKAYYKHLNIEKFITTDLLSNIASYLELHEMCAISKVSKTMNKASNIATKQQKEIGLTIMKYNNEYNDLDEEGIGCLEYHNKIYPHCTLWQQQILTNKSAQIFIQKFWKQFRYIDVSQNGDLCEIMNFMNLKLDQHLTHLIFPYSFKMAKWLTYGINLQFIFIKLQDTKIWNILIKNCPNLHCIVFMAGNVILDINDENYDQLLVANSLWSLTITADIHSDDNSLPSDFIQSILRSSPNLYHCCIDVECNFDKKWDLPTKNLISLSIGRNAEDFKCDLSMCSQLKCLEIPLDIDDMNSLGEMLSTFINNHALSNIIYIAITDRTSESLDDIVDLGADDPDDDNQVDTIFTTINAMLLNNYGCDQNNIENCRVLIIDSCNYETYAKKFATLSLGLSEDKIISEENGMHFIAQKALKHDHEFVLFCKTLTEIGVTQDLKIGDRHIYHSFIY